MGLVARIGYPIDVSAYFLLVSEPQNGQSRVKVRTAEISGLNFGSPARTRTTDPVINSHLLYRLSYWGI
jgi:hypothetical protein